MTKFVYQTNFTAADMHKIGPNGRVAAASAKTDKPKAEKPVAPAPAPVAEAAPVVEETPAVEEAPVEEVEESEAAE